MNLALVMLGTARASRSGATQGPDAGKAQSAGTTSSSVLSQAGRSAGGTTSVASATSRPTAGGNLGAAGGDVGFGRSGGSATGRHVGSGASALGGGDSASGGDSAMRFHDHTGSQWADYGCNGRYLDEKTSGYTVAHHVLVNCPTNTAQNQVQAGANTITDNGGNPQGAQNTIAPAGIESRYRDIRNLTVPAAQF